MAETAIIAVLSKFGELAASEAKILLHVGDDMMLLRDRLEWLQAFIRDADRKRRAGTDQLTRVWVRQTRDVAFEAEDALDKFFYEVDLKSQGYRGWKIWCKYLTGFCTQISIRHGLSARFKRINRRLEKISENQKQYKIEHTPLVPVTSSTTAASAWQDDAVGFDNDVVALKDMLLRGDHPRQMFISIIGESGVGKHTLVGMIYSKLLFEVKVWYVIPPDSTTNDLLQQIYKRVAENCTEEENADRRQPEQDKIRRLLATKKYLVILSGISSKTMLNCVRASLPDDNNGSRVVVILDTEREELAWHANTMNMLGINGIHMLSRLDEERSGQLFCSRAFRKEISHKMESTSMYDKIVYDITGGYPLAIVVLAGLLRFKEYLGQWEAVLQHLRPGPGMEEAQDGEGNQIIEAVLCKKKRIEGKMCPARQANLSTRTTIERVFWASFEDLPNDLKSCFLYFAAYPKDTTLAANEIVRISMAEGFIKPQKGKTMEELGHNCLKELVLRCLVQIENMNDAGGIKDVSVHKSLHGFLYSEVREAGFFEVHDMHDVFVPPSVRRLSFMSLGGRYTTFTNKFPKLRSFICWVVEEEYPSNDIAGVKKRWHDLKFLIGSKFLRVIDITGLRLKELPSEICDMVHLRYLRVDSKDLKEIPSSIKRLLNLQTLDIRGTQVEEIHQSFWKIKTLRHVLAHNLALPASIKEELDELQTLHGVKPAKEGEWNQQNCPLLKMTKLLSLELHGFEDAKHGDALQTALRKMHVLGHLKLKGDETPSWVFTEQGLRCLQTVDLDGTVQWPPVDAFNVLLIARSNLVQLSLTNTDDAPEDIQEELRKVGFNRLPSLQVYRLSYKQGSCCGPAVFVWAGCAVKAAVGWLCWQSCCTEKAAVMRNAVWQPGWLFGCKPRKCLKYPLSSENV